MSRKFKLSSFTPSLGGSWRSVLSMMREEKLYSAMYILGTALAIAFTMLIAEVYYIKIADISPEVHRSKTYILDNYSYQESGFMGYLSADDFFQLFQKMKTPDYVIAVTDHYNQKQHLKLADGFYEQDVKTRMVEPGFFRFYQFNFTEGAPFTQDDFDNARPLVVITEAIREMLFGKGKKGVGKTLKVDNLEYRICGIVESPSVLTENCMADLWFPFSLENVAGYDRDFHNLSVNIYFCVSDAKHEAFMQELKGVQARFNSMHKDKPMIDIHRDVMKYTTRTWWNIASMFYIWGADLFWIFAPAIMLLLLVPALNLGGMVASRMERRLPEMAIRKAFGAKRRTLLCQVIMENLMLTLIGGAIGLCLAWTALYGWRDWVFHIFSDYSEYYDRVPIINGEMFFGPIIFLIALLTCTVLNVLAATLPAWFSLRKPIVESMMIRK